MKDDSGSLIFGILIIMWIFYPSSEITKTKNTYYALCDNGWNGWACNGKEHPTPINIEYSVAPATSKVVFKLGKSRPDLLEKCTILDVDNWDCPQSTMYDKMDYSCTDGVCKFGALTGSIAEQIGIVRYYLYKISSYLD